MRDSRVNYIVVGTFTLLVLIGFLMSLAVLTGRTGAIDSYFTVFENIGGISTETQVLFQGDPVGQVEDIGPIRQDGRLKYQVELRVRRYWQIPEDSVVFLTTGLLAAVNVNIQGGTSQVVLQPGAEITSHEPADLFVALTHAAGDVTDLLDNTIKPLLKRIGDAVGIISQQIESVLSDDDVESVHQTLTNLEAASGDTTRLIAELRTTRQSFDLILANVNTASRDAAALIAELRTTRERVDIVLMKVETMIDENEENVDQSLADLRYSLDAIARHIDALSRNLEGTTRNMSEFSREIRHNPALLLRGKSPPDDADGAAP